MDLYLAGRDRPVPRRSIQEISRECYRLIATVWFYCGGLLRSLASAASALKRSEFRNQLKLPQTLSLSTAACPTPLVCHVDDANGPWMLRGIYEISKGLLFCEIR